MEVTAETNTWSNQRRKRRLKLQHQIKCSTETSQPEFHAEHITEAKVLYSEQTSNEKGLQQNDKVIKDTEVSENELTNYDENNVSLDSISASNSALLGSTESCGGSNNLELDEKCNISKTTKDVPRNLKRPFGGNGSEPLIKRSKVESENNEVLKTNNNGPLLVGSLIVKSVSKTFMFELFYLRGTGGRDSAHQVLQYLKNKFMLEPNK